MRSLSSRAPGLVALSLLSFFAVTACGGPPRAGGARSVRRIEPVLAASAWIRLITIAWEGAEGAPEAVERDRSQALVRAETIASMLREPGASFVEVARQYDDLHPGAESQFYAPRELHQGDPEVDDAIERGALVLQIGDVSEPIETAHGFVIAARTEPPAPTRLTEISARHLLVSFAGARAAGEDITRTRDEALARANEALRRARAGENWNALVAEYTDEPDAPEGGDLGAFERGRMVPSFERAAFALEVGGISDVVESDFGFHVIQRYR